MKGALCMLLMAAGLAGGDTPANTVPLSHPKMSRVAINNVARKLDDALQQQYSSDAIDLLGVTRGLYLEGYGIVFTTEVNLLATATINPFHSKYTPEQIRQVKAQKASRLPILRQHMRELMFASAESLNELPANESVVVSANVFYFTWEDSAGLPTQIVMQAKRRTLLDLQHGIGDRTKLESEIRVQEY